MPQNTQVGSIPEEAMQAAQKGYGLTAQTLAGELGSGQALLVFLRHLG